MLEKNARRRRGRGTGKNFKHLEGGYPVNPKWKKMIMIIIIILMMIIILIIFFWLLFCTMVISFRQSVLVTFLIRSIIKHFFLKFPPKVNKQIHLSFFFLSFSWRSKKQCATFPPCSLKTGKYSADMGENQVKNPKHGYFGFLLYHCYFVEASFF